MIDERMVRQECAKLGDVWEALSKITTDLKERGVNVPADVYTSLRGTRVLITLCRGHPNLKDLVLADIETYKGFCVACCDTDIVARTRCELRNVEDLLVLWATKELGSKLAIELRESEESMGTLRTGRYMKNPRTPSRVVSIPRARSAYATTQYASKLFMHCALFCFQQISHIDMKCLPRPLD